MARARQGLTGALMATAVAGQVVAVAQQAAQAARRRAGWTITVDDVDPAYRALHAALVDLTPDRARRALRAASVNGHTAWLHDATGTTVLRIDGHLVSAELSRDTPAVNVTTGRGDQRASGGLERLRLTAWTEAGRVALGRFVDQVIADHHARQRPPRLRVAAKWGGWTSGGPDDEGRPLPARPMASVVLTAGQLERITADVDRFLGAEGDYARIGLPWRRGIVLHGPPRTGKTSVVTAMATEFGLDVAIVPLSDLESDAALWTSMATLGPRTLLLLEDVDVVAAARDRDEDEGERVTMSGLLNALDGVATPHGLLWFATTNRLDVLDDALVGRAGLIEEVGYADVDQVDRLLALAFPGVAIDLAGGVPVGLSPQRITEACLRHLGSPAAAVAELADMGVVAGFSDGELVRLGR